MLCVHKLRLQTLRIAAGNVNTISFTRKNSDSHTNRIPELAAAYVPKEVEKYDLNDAFFAPPKTNEDRFSLILPPPNVTGSLHLGHALTTTIQDVLVKWNRMCGKETVWIPGMDHAGIATQVIVEKKLWSETGKTRHEIGREKFVDEVWQWKREKSDVIGEQLRRLGSSLDWRKGFFTMDEIQSRAVIEAFISLHERNLIYEDDALVNWSCILRSAISDIEVDHLNISGSTKITVPGYDESVEFGVMHKFAYKIDETDEEIVVATTRPETMLGDVAVAVHPRDERYTPFVGKKLWHPFRKQTIPIVCDEFVDPDFGTGAVKITPAHDPNDFEIAKRNSLPILNAITEDGKINASGTEFHESKRFAARIEILKALSDLGLFRGRQDHSMVVPICSRSKDVVEFLVKPQWFVNCDEMARKAVGFVKSGELKIEPKQYEKVWFHWLENIRNWCISRQLWWGHRIPIYICTYNNETIKIAARSHEDAKNKATLHWNISETGNISIRQVDDVLDTWFSSALLPFSCFGWPQKTDDLSKNYPLSLMETGHDILFFWVARMVMLGTHLTETLPFSKILLHGVVCDSRGKKMSKSLGNVIAPEDVISGRTLKELEEASKLGLKSGVLTDEEFRNAVQGQKKMFPEGIPECGVDALRFTLCSHNIKNHYINFDVQECKTNKLFGNKLWQATKFSLKWCQEISRKQTLREKSPDILPEMDKWILSRLSGMVDAVNGALDDSDFHNATAALKNFLYYDFCDVYLETAKRGLKDLDSAEANSHCLTLVTCLDVGLRCLAPFMPYLSQHLHQQLQIHPAVKGAPIYFPTTFGTVNTNLEREVEVVLNVVTGIRRVKKVFNLTAKHKREALLISKERFLEAHANTITDLAGFERVTFHRNDSDVEMATDGDGYVRDTISDSTVIYVYVPVELKKALTVDLDRMEKKRAKLTKDLEKMRVNVSSDGYKIKVSTEGHAKNMEKILLLEEKISRIDYVKALVSNTL